MFRARKSLTVLSQRTFSTHSIQFNPSRILVAPIAAVTPSLTKCSRRIIPCFQVPHVRYQSTDTATIPLFIRRGDWICGKCQAHNFASRRLCFECQGTITEGRIFYAVGDWHCPTCDLPVQSRPHCFILR
jgi:hypothetical protein